VGSKLGTTTLFFAFSVVLHLMLLLLIYLQHYIPTTRQIVFRDLVYATLVALLTFSVVVRNYCC
jgi:hypothetical protein